MLPALHLAVGWLLAFFLVLGRWLYDWQTLIAGGAALLAAAYTVDALNKQARDEAERKVRAARSMLQPTLSAVVDYSILSVRWLISNRGSATFNDQSKFNAGARISIETCPRPDSEIFANLRECVATFDIEKARYISRLIGKIQVHHSRMASFEDYFRNWSLVTAKRVGLRREIDVYIADSVEIAILARHLFPYARMETEDSTPPIDGLACRGAFRECGLDEIQDVEAWNTLTNRYPQPIISIEVSEGDVSTSDCPVVA